MITRERLERASRRVVFRRRLPDAFGGRPLWVTPGAALSYWRRDLRRVDGRLLGWAESLVREGDRVWDVGANLGLFTFAAAVRSGSRGSVLALEPDPRMCKLLTRSREFAGPDEAPVDVVNAAAAAEDGSVHLTLMASSSMNFVGDQPPGIRPERALDRIEVQARSLDSFWAGSRAPDLLKIDVEGFEAEVLSGASRMLAEARPRVIVEVLAHNSERVTRLLRGKGYVLHDLERPSWPVTEVATYSTLALPE